MTKCDGSSMAERLLPKEKAEGPIPFHRSHDYLLSLFRSLLTTLYTTPALSSETYRLPS